MSAPVPAEPGAREAFDRLLTEMRPRLHRYCARMTGSALDGEDVAQEAMLKAVEAFGRAGAVEQPQSWLFRIAHNAALDHLRRRARREATMTEDELEMIADPSSPAEARLAAAASLRTFMRLPVAQRSAVILMDVLGYSIREIGEALDASEAGVKAMLHRGRARLRELMALPEDDVPPRLSEADRSRLRLYVDRFNARDFDAVRDMLAEDVRVDLPARGRFDGRAEVASKYLHNYGRMQDWRLAVGFVEGRPAVLAFDPRTEAARPAYFILLTWADGKVARVWDFRFAKYAAEAAAWRLD
jgi:RNA polymerase sigma-70 factor (ECF subfamily)